MAERMTPEELAQKRAEYEGILASTSEGTFVRTWERAMDGLRLLDYIEALQSDMDMLRRSDERILRAKDERIRELEAAIIRANDVIDHIGIYPASFVGKYEQRTERMNGWNEAVKELAPKVVGALEPFSTELDDAATQREES